MSYTEDWPFWREIEPRYNRRAKWHDYKSRSIYMITITRQNGLPAFGSLALKNNSPVIELSPIGKMIEEELGRMCEKYPELSTYKTAVMPDHLHFVLNVSKDIDYHIGTAIGDFKRACSKKYKELYNLGDSEISLFSAGYHDRILLKKGQLRVMTNYVRDNPKRLYIKSRNKELFTQNIKIRINGETFDAFGNIFLLRRPDIEAVKVSSKYSYEELKSKDAIWIRTIEEGGVLVSPFISPKEKVYRDLAIDHNANIIQLVNNGFGDRFKPNGRYFDLCAAGRLLLIAPTKHNYQHTDIDRQTALKMNDLAEAISFGHFEANICDYKKLR